MGEIADMMLDGTMCSTCGEYLDGDDVGYPQQCAACSTPHRKKNRKRKRKRKAPNKPEQGEG